MNYFVQWQPAALGDMAAAWLHASPEARQEITRAARAVDKLLSVDADEVGESRSGNERIAFQSPLVITFRVDRLRAIVRVLHVWRY